MKKRICQFLIILLFLTVAAGAATITKAPADSGGPVTVTASDVGDATVSAVVPNQNFGTRPHLNKNVNTQIYASFAFTSPTGVAEGPYVGAQLHLHVIYPGHSCLMLNRSTAAINELTITWNTKPAISNAVVCTDLVQGWNSVNVGAHARQYIHSDANVFTYVAVNGTAILDSRQSFSPPYLTLQVNVG